MATSSPIFARARPRRGWCPHDLPHDVIGGASILHVSGISQAISAGACDTVFAAIEAAGARGARVSYDPNLRTKLWPSRGRGP